MVEVFSKFSYRKNEVFSHINHTDSDKSHQIYKSLSNAQACGYLMTCARLNPEVFYGVAGGHAYGILGVFDEIDRHGKNVRLIKVRNPWGKAI